MHCGSLRSFPIRPFCLIKYGRHFNVIVMETKGEHPTYIIVNIQPTCNFLVQFSLINFPQKYVQYINKLQPHMTRSGRGCVQDYRINCYPILWWCTIMYPTGSILDKRKLSLQEEVLFDMFQFDKFYNFFLNKSQALL